MPLSKEAKRESNNKACRKYRSKQKQEKEAENQRLEEIDRNKEKRRSRNAEYQRQSRARKKQAMHFSPTTTPDKKRRLPHADSLQHHQLSARKMPKLSPVVEHNELSLRQTPIPMRTSLLSSSGLSTTRRPALTPQEKLSYVNESLNRRSSSRKHRIDTLTQFLKEEGDNEAAEEAEFRSHVQNQPEDVAVDLFNARQSPYSNEKPTLDCNNNQMDIDQAPVEEVSSMTAKQQEKAESFPAKDMEVSSEEELPKDAPPSAEMGGDALTKEWDALMDLRNCSPEEWGQMDEERRVLIETMEDEIKNYGFKFPAVIAGQDFGKYIAAELEPQDKGARLGSHRVIKRNNCYLYVTANERDEDFESDDIFHSQGLPAVGYPATSELEAIMTDGTTVNFQVAGAEACECNEVLTELFQVLAGISDVHKCKLTGPDPYNPAPVPVKMKKLVAASNNPANRNLKICFHKARITNDQQKALRLSLAVLEFDCCVFDMDGLPLQRPSHPNLKLVFSETFPSLDKLIFSLESERAEYPLKSLHLDGGLLSTTLTDKKQLDLLRKFYLISKKPGSNFSFSFNRLKFLDPGQRDSKFRNMGSKDVRKYVCGDDNEDDCKSEEVSVDEPALAGTKCEQLKPSKPHVNMVESSMVDESVENMDPNKQPSPAPPSVNAATTKSFLVAERAAREPETQPFIFPTAAASILANRQTTGGEDCPGPAAGSVGAGVFFCGGPTLSPSDTSAPAPAAKSIRAGGVPNTVPSTPTTGKKTQNKNRTPATATRRSKRLQGRNINVNGK